MQSKDFEYFDADKVKPHFERRWLAILWTWLQSLQNPLFCHPHFASLSIVQPRFWRINQVKKNCMSMKPNIFKRRRALWIWWGPRIKFYMPKTSSSIHPWQISKQSYPRRHGQDEQTWAILIAWRMMWSAERPLWVLFVKPSSHFQLLSKPCNFIFC
jgi:hypothetical protein